MLSSTNRRILNIICVSMAIVAMVIGLQMKYSSTTDRKPIGSEKPAIDLVVKTDSTDYREYIVAEPN